VEPLPSNTIRLGGEIEKISATATSIFAYDGENMIEEANGSGSEVASYTQGPNIDEHLAMLRGTATNYYEQDGLGSVTSLTNSTGSAAQTYTYDSFGNQTASSGSLTSFYTGREFDTETGLYYYRARYYDSQVGRFLSEDLLRFGVGAKLLNARSGAIHIILTPSALRGRSADFYGYVSNAPVSNRDPLGLWQATVGGGVEVGVLITFGHNNGTWDFGFDVGGGDGAFLSIDSDEGDYDCGLNIHGEGDLGLISEGMEGLAASFNMSKSGTSAGLTLADPVTPNMNIDLTDSPVPHPTFGMGAGAVVGVGYTWSW